MSPKIYTQEFKEAAVKYYERNHTIAETLKEFGISESSLFDWKRQYDQQHDLIINGTFKHQNFRQLQEHLRKTECILEVLRKAPCGGSATIDEKMAAIQALEGQYSIHVLCEALNLPRGTYYNRKRKENQISSYEKNDELLKPIIRQIFYDSKRRFGRKPIQHKLSELGYRVSEKRVCRLMKEMGLEIQKPQFLAEHQKPLPRMYYKNYLRQQFEQDAPNKAWVSDITYVKVGESCYYICVVIDLFSRRLLSYGISDIMDSTLTLRTFTASFAQRRKPQGLMFHSDQGVQYTAYVFRQYLREQKVKQSFSKPGNPYDNSVCESFFHTLKKEAIYHHLYDTPDELNAVLEEYVHFYNEERLHRKLNMKTPLQIETEFIGHA